MKTGQICTEKHSKNETQKIIENMLEDGDQLIFTDGSCKTIEKKLPLGGGAAVKVSKNRGKVRISSFLKQKQ